jgi:hypothetical protein
MPHYWKLYMQDPFHTVVNMRLSKVLGSLMFAVRCNVQHALSSLVETLTLRLLDRGSILW